MANKKRIRKLLKQKYKSNSNFHNWNRFIQIFGNFKTGYFYTYDGGRSIAKNWKTERFKEYLEYIEELKKTSKSDFERQYYNYPVPNQWLPVASEIPKKLKEINLSRQIHNC